MLSIIIPGEEKMRNVSLSGSGTTVVGCGSGGLGFNAGTETVSQCPSPPRGEYDYRRIVKTA